jgi:hypothetical protein
LYHKISLKKSYFDLKKTGFQKATNQAEIVCIKSVSAKVMVARLIAESVLRNRGGELIVTPRPQAIPFYLHLGFQPMNRDPKLFFLREETGVQLLQSVLLGSRDE